MSDMLAGRHILVVEDEIMLLLMIEDVLADLGCTSVTSAGTVDRAIALIEAQVFDVAMLDLNLNGQMSFPIADKLAERGVPFLFSTGYSSDFLKEGYGDRPVLRKPYS